MFLAVPGAAATGILKLAPGHHSRLCGFFATAPRRLRVWASARALGEQSRRVGPITQGPGGAPRARASRSGAWTSNPGSMGCTSRTCEPGNAGGGKAFINAGENRNRVTCWRHRDIDVVDTIKNGSPRWSSLLARCGDHGDLHHGSAREARQQGLPHGHDINGHGEGDDAKYSSMARQTIGKFALIQLAVGHVGWARKEDE